VLGKKVSQNKDGILIQRGTNPSFFASEAANLAKAYSQKSIDPAFSKLGKPKKYTRNRAVSIPRSIS
jgi:hypothetical protein